MTSAPATRRPPIATRRPTVAAIAATSTRIAAETAATRLASRTRTATGFRPIRRTGTIAEPGSEKRSRKREGSRPPVFHARTSPRGTTPGEAISATQEVATSGLRYVQEEAGIRRFRRGAAFRYRDPSGRTVVDRATLERIRALAVPPAWKEVWICADDRGHLQATGRDARGRKQYRYHPDFVAARDRSKFDRLETFGRALPRLRRRVSAALAGTELSRDRVLAAVVVLLDRTFARVGNREYLDANGSYGLTTLENRHARISADRLRLRFRGKSGVFHEVEVANARLARLVRRCQSLPGQKLFEYEDESGAVSSIDSGDVNAWLRQIAGIDLSAKEFRTWHGSRLALAALASLPAPGSRAAARRSVTRVVDGVAERLGNTASVTRRHYVHPEILSAFERGELAGLKRRSLPRVARLGVDERLLLAWLGRQAKKGTAPPTRRRRRSKPAA